MLLTAIIVNYNVKHLVYQCVRSLLRGTWAHQVEVIVVDNASTDGSEAFLREAFASDTYRQVRLLFSSENLGFGRANNWALEQAQGKYVLFINPDTIVTEHTLQACYTFAEAHPNLGALGVYMMHDDGRYAPESKRGVPTPLRCLYKMLGLVTLYPESKRVSQYYMGHLSKDKPAKIEIVSGAYMWLRRDALQAVGGFDEAFFMYGEDIDLSYCMLKSGRQNYYLPTPILHYKGESTVKTSWRYVKRFYEAMLIFYNKHFKHHHPLAVWGIKTAILGSGLVALLRSKLGGRKVWVDQRQYLFVVSPKARIVAEQLVERHALQADYTTPESWWQQPTMGQGCCVVYDAECIDYATMLHHLQSHPATQKLGTLYASKGYLLTQQRVYSLL